MDKHEIDPDATPTGEGYFTEDDGTKQAGCDDDTDRCAPDDYDPDPHADRNTPGTEDDLPYTLGEQNPRPADQHVIPVSEPTRRDATRRPRGQEPPEGAKDEAELWRAQKSLIEEDEKTAYNLEGIDEEDIPDVLEAIGDDAADPLPDAPNGTSATGSVSTPEHGGFPEREE